MLLTDQTLNHTSISILSSQTTRTTCGCAGSGFIFARLWSPTLAGGRIPAALKTLGLFEHRTARAAIGFRDFRRTTLMTGRSIKTTSILTGTLAKAAGKSTGV
tara:strand:- start:76 stop:384 length:309 start_codon:yes stop_codon:yes gene_type:complete